MHGTDMKIAVMHVSVCLKHAAKWQASAGESLFVMGYRKLSISELAANVLCLEK